jgi:hypothetical protein
MFSPVVLLPLDSQWSDLNPKCKSKWPLLYIYTVNRKNKRSPPRCIVIYNSYKCVSITVIEMPCIPEGKTSYSTDLSWHIYIYNLHCWWLLGSREPWSSEMEQRSAIYHFTPLSGSHITLLYCRTVGSLVNELESLPPIMVAYFSTDIGIKFITNTSLERYRYTNLLRINVSQKTAQGIPFLQLPSFK